VPHTPFALSFAVLNADASVDLSSIRARARRVAGSIWHEVRVRAPGDSVRPLDALAARSVLADPAILGGVRVRPLERAGAKIIPRLDPCQLPKACKNEASLPARGGRIFATGAALSRFSPGSRARRPRVI